MWSDIRAINELKDKDFSTRCPDCAHQDIFFGIEAIEICHGELSPIERMELTGPSFCTKASERGYITTSSGKDINGGSQGAVGDRRATICGENVPGAGGL